MADIDQLKQDYSAFCERVDEGDFVAAKSLFDVIRQQVDALDTQTIAECSKQEQQWLMSLASELQGERLSQLQRESQKLVEKIAPFNKNSALNRGKHYQGE